MVRISWVVAVCMLLAGCSGNGNTVARCRTNAECGAYRVCDTAAQQCLCADSRGCGRGEFCNVAGACQVIAGCLDNSDCEATGNLALICDVKAGQCGTPDECFDDSHCALGNICNAQTRQCFPGCYDEGDCVLGAGCVRAQPNDPIGSCVSGSCTTSDQCNVGYNCDLTTNRCVPDDRGPFCGACQRFDPYDPQCGDPANYCLIDTGDPSRRGHYCGVDCSQEQGCPNGYECKDVIIVGPPATPACAIESCVGGVCTATGAPCGSSLDCPQGPPRGDCVRAQVGICAGTTNTECTSDVDCGGSEGSCRLAECRLREQAAYGFCTCVIDSDCPRDDCRNADLSDPGNPVMGHCLLSGHACYESGDCDVIACVNGGCLIGRNCKPGADRRCADLQRSPD